MQHHKIMCKDLPLVYRNALRRWKKQYKKNQLDPKIIEEFQNEGIAYLLSTKMQKAEERCHTLCQFIINNKRHPIKTSNDPQEKKLAYYLCATKQSKVGNSNNVFYPSLQVIANSYNLPNIFDIGDKKKYYSTKAEQYCQFVKAYKRKPSITSKMEYERSLCFWFKNLNRSNKFREEKKAILQKVNDVFKSFNLDIVLKPNQNKCKAEDNCRKVCEFINANKRNPNILSKDPKEKLMAFWLKRTRAIKKGIAKKGIFYPSLQEIANSYGIPNLFP